MSNGDYDPHSTDAMFSRIISRLDAQDHNDSVYRSEMKEMVARIQDSVDGVGSRVNELEKERWHQRGFVAAIALLASAAWHWLTTKHN